MEAGHIACIHCHDQSGSPLLAIGVRPFVAKRRALVEGTSNASVVVINVERYFLLVRGCPPAEILSQQKVFAMCNEAFGESVFGRLALDGRSSSC
jgi:hypothetical protein